jgi:hypothetical protein
VDGGIGSTRIIFGAYIQLITAANGIGDILKLQDVVYDRATTSWTAPYVANSLDLTARMDLISIIKTTLDYQERIHSDLANNRPITVDTDIGCFTGTIEFPSNVYTLVIPPPSIPMIVIPGGASPARKEQARMDYNGILPAYVDALKAHAAAVGAVQNIAAITAYEVLVTAYNTWILGGVRVPLLRAPNPIPVGNFRYAGEIGYYDANNFHFVKTNSLIPLIPLVVPVVPDIMNFNDPECPYVETRLATRAVKQAGGSYYKKYLKYKNKYLNQILIDDE